MEKTKSIISTIVIILVVIAAVMALSGFNGQQIGTVIGFLVLVLLIPAAKWGIKKEVTKGFKRKLSRF